MPLAAAAITMARRRRMLKRRCARATAPMCSGPEPYLLASWHPCTRPAALDLAHDETKWVELEVRKHLRVSTELATVEFVTRYNSGCRAARLHEVSRFVREGGRWFYLDGEFIGLH